MLGLCHFLDHSYFSVIPHLSASPFDEMTEKRPLVLKNIVNHLFYLHSVQRVSTPIVEEYLLLQQLLPSHHYSWQVCRGPVSVISSKGEALR
jgi:hypothetical protein